MNESSSDQQRRRQSAIEAAVERFLSLTEAGHSPATGQFLQEHQDLLPELSVQLQAALQVRAARLAAAQPSATGPDSDGLLFTDSSGDGTDFEPQDFGPFTLLRRIGGGGFGMVYEATKEGVGNRIAIKTLRPDRASDPVAVQRFREEAVVTGRLKHPGVVPILEVGEHAAKHYLVMPLIDGVDLHRFSRSRAMEPKLAATIMRGVAEACRNAHDNNVVHRDLKPANILIQNGTQKAFITDFGLAKTLDQGTRWTPSLQKLGTPHYMAPEQADRRLGPVGRATDVYGLGATLYFLLTGGPPFPTESGLGTEATLQQIQWDEPVPPSRISKALPRDLEIICLKCLCKFPIDRYPDAGALAEDLERFVAGKPIATRLPGPSLRLRRWCQRRPAPAAALALLVISLVVGTATSGMFANRAKKSSEVATIALAEKQIAVDNQRAQEYLTDIRGIDALWQRGEIDRIKATLAKYASPADQTLRGFEWGFWQRMAQQPSPMRCDVADSDWSRLSFDATGKNLAGVDRAGRMIVWDAESSTERFRVARHVRSAVFTPDQKYALLLQSEPFDPTGRIEICSAADGSAVASLTTGRMTTCIAALPDSSGYVTATPAGDLFEWSLPNGREKRDLTAGYKNGPNSRSLDIQHGAALDMAFSADGRYLVVGYEDGTVLVWEMASARIIARTTDPHTGPVTGVCISPDGSLVASQSYGEYNIQLNTDMNGEVRVWERETGKPLQQLVPHPQMVPNPTAGKDARSFRGGGPKPFAQFRPLFSADGRRLYTTGDRSVHVYDVKTSELLDEFRGHDGLVLAIAISPDGGLIAGAGDKHSVRAWSTTTSRFPKTLCTAKYGIHGIAFSPDGARIAAVCEDGAEFIAGNGSEQYARSERRMIRVWDAKTGITEMADRPVETWFETPRFSEKGAQVGAGDRQWGIPMRPEGAVEDSTQWGKEQASGVRIEQLVSPDGTFVVRIKDGDPTPELVRTGTTTGPLNLTGHTGSILAATISRDGRWIATAAGDRSVRVWSAQDGSPKGFHSEHSDAVTALAFSPDSSLLASGGMDKRAVLWKCASAEKVAVLQGHRREISGLTFSQDGRRLASSAGLLRVSGVEPGEIMVWDVRTGQACVTLRAEMTDIYPGVAFSSDGNRLYASASDANAPAGTVPAGRIVLWDVGEPAK